MDTTTVYADIVKHERNADGDLMVFGRATGPDLDLDRQICDPAWLAKAMPDWFSTGANVREQHRPDSAAGVGTELTAQGDGWALSSLVVDPVSARKVEKGVLRGYSIGIRAPQVVKDATAPGGRIVGGTVVEVSLVDRPANPTCTLTLTKALKPGPQGGQQVDAERRLIKVEELHDRAGEPLAAYKALGFDLVAVRKGDEAGDIADAQQAIAIIAGLIQSEAVELADGQASEACDIDLLLQAVRALEWFIARENQEDSPMAVTVGLSADADATKLAADQAAELEKAKKKPAFLENDDDADSDSDDDADASDDDADSDTPPKKKTSKSTDLTELVKAAVAEAVAPIQAQLAKAMSAPALGGPVLTRTQRDTTKAAAREGLLVKATERENTALALHGASRDAYLAEARELRRQADTITS